MSERVSICVFVWNGLHNEREKESIYYVSEGVFAYKGWG